MTHSLCTLEFADNRAVYDWLMDNLWEGPRPHQYEFGRRSLEYTVVSKRKLIQLIDLGAVTGWDDPRMPTLTGLRRRGVRPGAIRDFASRIGISRTNRTVDIALLEYAIRHDLNPISPRVMAVVDPLKVVLTNYPEGQTETLEAPYWPHDIPNEGSRGLPFGRVLYLERGDFREKPERGFRRLTPGGRVRLRHAYVIHCDEVVKDEAGHVTELRCTYEPDTLGEARNVPGVIHWVAADGAVPAEFRLYDRLFKVPNPEADDVPFVQKLNPDSLVIKNGFVEPSVQDDAAGTHYQFERTGFFVQDALDSRPGALIFNRTITLRDTWGADDTAASQPRTRRPARPTSQLEGPRDVTAEFSTAEVARFTALVQGGVGHEEAAVLARDEALGTYFDEAMNVHVSSQLASWVVGEVARERSDDGAFKVTAQNLAELVSLIEDGTLSTRLAKEVFRGDGRERTDRQGDRSGAGTRAGLRRGHAGTPGRRARCTTPGQSGRLPGRQNRLAGVFCRAADARDERAGQPAAGAGVGQAEARLN